DEALLEGEPAVGVLRVQDEGVDATGDGDADVAVPEPPVRGEVGLRAPFEFGAPAPLHVRDRLREVRLRESAGEEEPAVVGDDADLAPAGGEEGADAGGDVA